jgi:predicted DCC family thiol-disulfide oxidoreductase YuxK
MIRSGWEDGWVGPADEPVCSADGAALPVMTGRADRGAVAALTVYYNSDCAIWRARVARYQARGAAQAPLIAWCDVARVPWALRRQHIDGGAARRRIHVIDAHGQFYSGGAALARLWRALPGYRWLGYLLALPGASVIAEGAYRLAITGMPVRLGREEARHG